MNQDTKFAKIFQLANSLSFFCLFVHASALCSFAGIRHKLLLQKVYHFPIFTSQSHSMAV
jgi:hypothetical protein